MSVNLKYFLNKMLRPEVFLATVVFGCVFPLILLSYFVHPSADDFCYNTAYPASNYFETQVILFNNLNGRYTTSAILSISAFLSNSLVLYKLMPVILIVLLFFSVYYLASSLCLNLRKLDCAILALLFLGIYVIQMPSLAQGFYWLSSSVCYQLSAILVLFLFGLIAKILYSKANKSVFLAVFLLIIVIGLNEIAMLLTDFLLLSIFLFSIFKNKRINYKLLLLVFVALIFSFMVFNSAGNNLRGEVLPNSNLLFYSVGKAVNTSKSYLIIWLPIAIVSILLFYGYFNKNKFLKTPKVFEVPPLLILVYAIAVIFIGFFIGYWATGTLLPPRAVNLIFFFFLAISIYFTLVLFFYLNKKHKKFIVYSANVRYMLFVCLVFLIAQKDNVKTAVGDLVSGSAYKYDKQLKERYELIKNSKSDTIYVSELKYKPKTIFFDDITTNEKDWRNGCYNVFFKRNIILKEEK